MGKRRQRHGSMELVDHSALIREYLETTYRARLPPPIRWHPVHVDCSPDHCPTATGPADADELECRCWEGQ
jgi:hypothetical protein